MQQTIKNILDKKHSYWNFNDYGKQMPLLYVISATLAALVGYFFILCFPIGFLISVYKVSVLLPLYPIADNLTETLWWITLSLFLGHTSFNILTIDFATMPGLRINRKSAGRLFGLLNEINTEYPQPAIQQIIITEHYELKLVKIPQLGIPVCTQNALAIGLPLLLTLSPTQFKSLLTREIIRYSKRRNKIANWLSQLRDSWNRYLTVLKQRSCIGHQLLYGFFALYSPVYNMLATPACVVDELTADRNALDLINSDELLSAYQAKLIAQVYFEQCFWPEFNHAYNANSPFCRLQRIAKSALSQSNSDKWLQRHLAMEKTDENYPTLKQRLHNLGLTSVKLPPNLEHTAAEFYFQHQLAKIINMSDNNWLAKRCDRHASPGISYTSKEDCFNSATNKPSNSHKQSTA